nr:DUF1956 domain-containing protein [Desulfobacterales bacterium]
MRFINVLDPNHPDPSLGSAEDRLEDYIRTVIQNFVEKGRQGYFTRLYFTERANPTGLVRDRWEKLIEPRRRKLLKIIQEIMKKGGRGGRSNLLRNEHNEPVPRHSDRQPHGRRVPDRPAAFPGRIPCLADHVTRFSLAGIRAVAAAPIKTPDLVLATGYSLRGRGLERPGELKNTDATMSQWTIPT